MIKHKFLTPLVVTGASGAGLFMMVWPLLVPTTSDELRPPFVFLALVPLVLWIVVAELSRGGMDATRLAILGVLTAVNAVLRGLSAGTAGVELVFFLLILSGRVFGASFGFVLGATSLFASALLTGGVGPWLPFQMLLCAWIGMAAGWLPQRLRGRSEIVMLIGYGIVAAYLFGLLMNLVSWPFLVGIEVPGHQGISFVPGDSVLGNVKRFFWYTLVTSTGSWDTGRAITNTVMLLALGPAILVTLRRAKNRSLGHQLAPA
jgi:energy-coupling factor transport system substrate-specific component